MPTRRTPRRPNFRPQLTPAAIEAFRRLITLDSDSDREEWWACEDIISRELHCKVWEYPCIKDPSETAKHDGDRLAQARWAALAATL
jgi:hypothetical protein